MNDYIESVSEFHKTFNQPINTQNDISPLKLRQLRLKLLFEELQELSEASDLKGTFYSLCCDVVNNGIDNQDNIKDGDTRDKKEELDALCDLQYVLSGAVLSLGYSDIFDYAFDEVQYSNMSKACKTLGEVDKTMSDYKDKGVESYYISKGDVYIILRKEDDKILKSSFYKEADLHKFIK